MYCTTPCLACTYFEWKSDILDDYYCAAKDKGMNNEELRLYGDEVENCDYYDEELIHK